MLMRIITLFSLNGMLLFSVHMYAMHEMHHGVGLEKKNQMFEHAHNAMYTSEAIGSKNIKRSKRAHPNKISCQSMHDPVSAWVNPRIKPSAPPHLVGTQMGVVNTIGLVPMGYEMDGTIKVFRLIAQPIEQYITDKAEPDYETLIKPENTLPKNVMHHMHIKQKLRAWGFNGTTPGSTIEVTEGDRVRIIVTNELPEPLSVHWHGLELPNDQDGFAPYTQPVIMPGKSYTYEYTIYQSGTYFYHGEFNLSKASPFGLVGAFIVHPKKYEVSIDKQFVILLQEWLIPAGNIYPDLTNSFDFNWFTFNGHAAPSIPALTVNQDDRIRIRFINMSMHNHPIHWHGHTGWIVGTEAGPIPKTAQWPVNSVDIPPGAARDIEFVAWNPGVWAFHCHKLHHVMPAHGDIPMGIMPHGGMFTVLHVIPKDPKAPWRHPAMHDQEYKEQDHPRTSNEGNTACES